MSQNAESADAPEPAATDTPDLADALLRDPPRIIRMIGEHPEMLQHLDAGYRAAREGFSDVLNASDRGAQRVQSTADKVLNSVQRDLDREGITPEERERQFEREERILREVRANEREIRAANERSFDKLLAIGTTVAVGVVALGFLSKGKLPPFLPPSA